MLSTSLGDVEVDFTARHLAAERRHRARDGTVPLGLDVPDRLHVEFTEWRNQELPLPGGGVLINDAWNANPVSMRAALEHLVQLAAGRRTVAVLGDMAELGDYATRPTSRSVGRSTSCRSTRSSRSGRRRRAYGGRHVGSVEQAVAVLDGLLQPGDCVLVKGARVMGLERVAEALTGATA